MYWFKSMPMGTRHAAPPNITEQAGGGEAKPVFSAGEISVRASVSVTFALQ